MTDLPWKENKIVVETLNKYHQHDGDILCIEAIEHWVQVLKNKQEMLLSLLATLIQEKLLSDFDVTVINTYKFEWC